MYVVNHIFWPMFSDIQWLLSIVWSSEGQLCLMSQVWPVMSHVLSPVGPLSLMSVGCCPMSGVRRAGAALHAATVSQPETSNMNTSIYLFYFLHKYNI